MKEGDLKTCPFCGTDPTPVGAEDLRTEWKGHTWGFTISCETCGISMSDEYLQSLIAAWNTRHG